MLFSYLLIALQGLKKQPGFSLIKIFSLAIGLACSILVLMHVQFATNYDMHFPNSENIYRLVTSFSFDGRTNQTSMSSDAYGPQLKLDYPQIDQVVKIRPSGSLFSRNDIISGNSFHWVEPGVTELFSLEFISGNADTALIEPNVVVLNETAAQKYFPDEEAIGKTLTLNDEIDLRVSGVMKDLQENSIDLQILISVVTGRQMYGEDFMGGNKWNNIGGTYTFLSFSSQAEANSVSNDLGNFVNRNLPNDQQINGENEDDGMRVTLEPLSEIYLSKRASFGNENNRPQVLLGLTIFAVLILLTSCINFANLSLSQIHQRSKEIGVRKTLGAKRRQIVIQFIFESLLLTGLALLIALPLVYFAIPAYTNITGTHFTFTTVMKADSAFFLLLFVLVTGFLSGLFPALSLSRFEAITVIKGSSVRGRISRIVRSLVTVLQFGLASALMILAVAISLQINHLNTMDIGFNKENLIYFQSAFNPDTSDNLGYAAMLNEFSQHPGVESVTDSNCSPGSTCNIAPWGVPGAVDDETQGAAYYSVGINFLNTMGLNLLVGRWFSEDFPSDFIQSGELRPGPPQDGDTETHGIVITRDAVKYFGFTSVEDALDKILLNNGSNYRVLGVVEDFWMNGGMENPERSVKILRSTLSPMRSLIIRLQPDQQSKALKHINTVWERHRADIPIQINFFSQDFNDKVFEQTNGFNKSANFASIVTILVSIFGLYGLAYYSTVRRSKEIGARKVLGATSASIMSLLTWDFVKPVLAGGVISCFVAYVVINRFFEQFSSQIEVPIWVYLIVVMGTIILAIITVAAQCIKAANADPVLSLRYE